MDLGDLEFLNLVSKVTSELKNHLGEGDRTLAEFLISTRANSSSVDEFLEKLGPSADELPRSLIDSLDRLVLTMHPKMKNKAPPKSSRTMEQKENVFGALSMPDQEVPKDDAIDDALAMFEQLGGEQKKTKRRSRSPDGERRKHKRRREDRSRERRRSRSRSPHDGDNNRRNGHRDSDRGRRRTKEDEYDDRPPRRHRELEMDERPELDKIYEGHVRGIKPFGAFVKLHNVRGQPDGLVHISAMREGERVEYPEDVVSQNQPVWVKVVSVKEEDRGRIKIGLSMKEVDQETGEDLKARRQDQFMTGANSAPLGGAPSSHMPRDTLGAPRSKKRISSRERAELELLVKAGVYKRSDLPELNEEFNASMRGETDDQTQDETIAEFVKSEPPFLQGQTEQSLELSPIRVAAAPNGSMSRAAAQGSELVSSFKEQKREEAQAKREGRGEDGAPQQPEGSGASFAPQMRPNAQRKPAASMPGKRANMSIKQQRESLPVFEFRKQLIQAVEDNQTLVVVGETGSGKTTQLTQYLAEAGFAENGVIGCTQPRRVAAKSVAARVAEERGSRLGDEVGYNVRFDANFSDNTRILYLTDGMLQRELIQDKDLKRYSCIMLDEAHERTVSTDVLFALLKRALKRRPDLKVIVTSATLDADKFSSYFHECPIFTIPGRTFPVEVLYYKEPSSDWVADALEEVMKIHLTEPAGDILVFLTGQDEIDDGVDILNERMKTMFKDNPNIPDLHVLPMYAQLPPDKQQLVFEPAPEGSRKVVLATNIAETSITIDGICYVVDTGYAKQMVYDPKIGMDSLVVTPISQAQAKQRAGRAGRTSPGKCFRLYTQAAYETELLPTPVPEIQRQNMSTTILSLKAMGINDLLHFDFMDAPPVNTMLTALEELYHIGALDKEGLLTRLGRRMANFPTEPSLAKALLAGVDYGCTEELLSILAMVTLPNVFFRPKDKQTQADQKKAKFHDPHGDHLTLLNVYNSWKQSGSQNAWCSENFIQARSMRAAQDARDQFAKILKSQGLPNISCGYDTQKVRQALCAGFFRNAARKDPKEGYQTLTESTPVYLHPSSALSGKQAEWVIYHTLVLTTREYMRYVTSIEPKWLVQAAPTCFELADSAKLRKRRDAEGIQPLLAKHQTGEDWRLSAQKKGGRTGGGGTFGG